MDPDANLEEQLELAQELMEVNSDDMDTDALQEIEEKASRLAELVLALDEWIERGGFLPKRWVRSRA